jgi:glycosyltransferase involved in cell wall biosynthesis
MDIVVCGAQVPFMRGGAELLMENLVVALERDGHRVDLVRLPTVWDRERVFDAALAWRMAPIDADLVIATNFPSYFVDHPHKRVWLLHQHRAAYDLAETGHSDFGLDDQGLEAQRLLADWDTRALDEAEALFTTSAVVADRVARYNGLSATPVYHPPPLHDRLTPGASGDYVFCPTRLEANKRPGLILEAVAGANRDVRAVIAGRGSLADELAARATHADLAGRVSLPGFVSDNELVDLYGGALAVLYAPLDEDYGYVTLQAFLAGKPVITTQDAGGVLEFVEDGVNGFVTDGSPRALGAAIDKLAGDRELARRLGEAGRARVADLSWSAVTARLLA